MSAKDEIRSLNTLRGVAALAVMLYHAPAMFGTKHWIPHAYLAVDLFFVISGFVIAHAYERKVAGGMPFGTFMRRRLARLYPLYLAVTVLGGALYLWKATNGLNPARIELFGAFGLNLLLIPAQTDGVLPSRSAYPFALQSWSIAWEIALCGVFFAWARWWGRGAAAIAAACAIALAWTAFTRHTLDGGFTYSSFWVGGVRAMFGFFTGIAVCHALARADQGVWRGWAMLAVPLTLASTGYIFFVRPTFWAADLLIALTAFPLMVATLVRFRPRWFENRVGDFLGEASYSVYLLHGLAINLAGMWLLKNPHIAQPWKYGFGLCWTAVVLALSWLCWRWFETPMRRALSGARPPRSQGRSAPPRPRDTVETPRQAA